MRAPPPAAALKLALDRDDERVVAVAYNITADQGATLHLSFLWRQPRTPDQVAAEEPGTPVDLTGFTARMHLRTEVAAPNVALELTTDNNRVILGASDRTTEPDPTTGIVTLWVEAAAMEALPAGTYVYDLELVSAEGFVTRFIEGKLKVRPEVTRTNGTAP